MPSAASRIGDITWHVVGGQDFLVPPVAFGDGFAALIADQDGVGGVDVATSDDGSTWETIPSPPATPGRLAARGDELYVAAPRLPTDVFVTTDRGSTWTAVPIEPVATGSIDELLTGPGGVLLTSEETSPRRELTMPPAVGADAGQTVRVTVEGITGRTGDDLAVVLYEGDELDDGTSTDGRAWTETPDSCGGIFLQASFGDRVYGATEVDRGVVSTDGGRTWDDPVVRPGGPGDWLTVGDLGLVAVETAIFAPPAGVVWVSADDATWERALNPWPPPLLDQPVVAGDTILVPGQRCDPGWDGCQRLDWIGTVDR